MPLLAPALTLDIVAFGASQGMLGSSFPMQADAISTAMSLFMVIPGTVTGNLAGVAGPGVVSAAGPLLGYEPTSMSATLAASLAQAGMLGPGTLQLSMAISLALCKNLPFLTVVGVSPVVSAGGGIGKVVGLAQPALYGLLMQQAAIRGMLGSELPRMMQGLSTGICSYLNAVATIPIVSVGPPVPPPPAGPIPMFGPVTLSFI